MPQDNMLWARTISLVTLFLTGHHLATATAATTTGGPLCSSANGIFSNPTQQAIACYAGTFVVNMLADVNAGHAMTQQHARWQLLPYLGGVHAIESLLSDSPRNSNCTACFADNATHAALMGMRDRVDAQQRARYDGLLLCYSQLTDSIMRALPKDKTGVYLTARPVPALQQTIELMRTVFQQGCVEEGCASTNFTDCSEVSGHTPSPGVAPGLVVGCHPTATNSSAPADRPTCGLHNWTWVNVCTNDTAPLSAGGGPTEAAAFCYLASFVQKMLMELAVSPPLGQARKTEQHVRSHLTPYLGGAGVTRAVATDVPGNTTCLVCWHDPVCYGHQLRWLAAPCCYDTSLPGFPNGVCPDSVHGFVTARDTFFALRPCYARMTNAVMAALPKHGKWLVPPRYPETPYSTTRRIFRGIVDTIGVSGCD